MSASLQPWPWIGPGERRRTSSSGFRTGSRVRSTRLTSAKIAALAPMPSASVAIATAANPGDLARPRIASRKSGRRVVMRVPFRGLSLAAQFFQRIGPARAAGGQVGGGRGDEEERRRDRDREPGSRREVRQGARQDPSGREREREAEEE